MTPALLPAAIPSPGTSSIHLGFLTIHFYALCILVGMALAVWLTMKRWRRRGQDPDVLWDIVFWAVIAGIVGARAYHVLVTDPRGYFGPGADPLAVLRIWEGGLGIMGAVLFGAAAAWVVSRRNGIPLHVFADCVAPALLLAQAVGRWGNWFNQELFGKPTTLPWGLEISPLSPNFPQGLPPDTLFHPTFLYESLWDLLGVVVLLLVDRRVGDTHGRIFALYMVYYGVGRMLIEMFLRVDPALMVAGVRVHVWTSLLIVLGGIVLYVLLGRRTGRGTAQESGVARQPQPTHSS
ncbi:prolipoprotein diacylglyceryl transferase [Kocuria rhizophila]|uniref:Phosphatidylglycerol--prolipoprotein diacylglyceryl transferase n=1 Tax=Kocuria rhizophila (strain ATCC 9341 / DSM 348 / NBRC 103217 / DC2201) TaxID=378753 RepID=B2GGV6_KOCRD|nr:prolipoprotein diacylglyceryl transferase [Kocuria rhizophila]ASE10573.1 prolipoprotein diacylglyceryl transferase [Kocuria rhizophila]MCC5671333.1 prolipoprotein diacylglyceryl transferase [Kocuria rhizophila]BAG29529.1 prolipoprotein diacylglyceryl transferase [Kocuria rhizophila DC2201]VEH75192.1 Prolipoprotein diacylglyceryl transferase [Kocuria rhizophila]